MKQIAQLFALFAIVFYANAQPIVNWQGTIGGSPSIRVQTTYYDEAQNLYVGGYFFNSVDFDFGPGQSILTAAGQYDAFVAKYNVHGDLQWVRRIGGANGEQVNGITVSGGIVYATGFFLGTTTFTAPNLNPQLTSAGQADIFIARYTADNGLAFTPYRIGGTVNEDATGIKSDAAGNIYLFGYIASSNVNFGVISGITSLSSSGANDGFIAKYDASLGLAWARIYGGGIGSSDLVLDLDIDQNGFVYAVGEFAGSPGNFNNGVTLSALGGSDGYVVKINSSGTTLWGRSIGGAGSTDAIRSIRVDGKGSMYVTGTFNGSVNLNPNGPAINLNTAGNTDIFVSKLDTNLATATWVRQMGGTNADMVYSLALDTLDNVYTTGSFFGLAQFPFATPASSLTSVGGSDVFVSKLNSSGNYVWSYRAGGPGTDLGISIHASKNGQHLFLGGEIVGQIMIQKLGECNDPQAITGTTNICGTSPQTYSIPAVTGATSYIWTLPAGWSGTSTTNSINAIPSANGGTISVAAVTSCGIGFSRNLQVQYRLDSIDKNLVRHWRADTLDQNRDRINNIQLSFTNTVKDTDRFGNPNRAYRITNKQGFISTGGGLPTGPTTISFWYYYEPSGLDNTLLGSDVSTLPAGHPLLYISNTSNLLVPYSNIGTNIGGGTYIAPNQWHHIALARNGSSFELYLNGNMVQSGGVLASTNFVRIGNNRPTFETQGATGKFDDIRIYNAQLTASQIQQIQQWGEVSTSIMPFGMCIGNNVIFTYIHSSSQVNYKWFKNTQAAGTNSSSFNTVLAANDTLVQVQIENQCVVETYGRSFITGSSVSSSPAINTCGSIQVGNKRYYRSGQYQDTLKTTLGCDSFVNLTLTIDNAPSIDHQIHYYTMNRADTLSRRDSIADLYGSNRLFVPSPTNYQPDRNGNPNSAIQITAGGFRFANDIPTQNRTISFWYYYTQTANTGGLICGNNGAAATIYLGVAQSGILYTENSLGTTVSNVQLANNTWHHISFSMSDTRVASVYVNGVFAYSTNTNGLATTPIRVIGSRSNNLNLATGIYDDLRVFNKAINASEAQSIFRRPGMLFWKPNSNYCSGESLNYTYAVTDTTETLFELYRNNTFVGNSLSAAFTNLTKADTSITLRIYNNCMVENYTTRLNISTVNDTIRANACGSYSFNNRTYTTSGLYYDTVNYSSTCNTFYALYVNITDTVAPRLSSNGLIRYWTANASDVGRDFTRGDTLSLIGTGLSYSNGRTNVTSNAIIMTNTTSVIRTNIPPMNVGTISFWYLHTTSATTKVLLGSNATTLPQGHPLLVVVNNQLNVWNNSGAGTSVGTLTNAWHHIVLVRNGSAYKLYLNGTLVREGNDLSPANFDRLGNNRPGFETQGASIGGFDDIFIYDRELTNLEVSILNNATSILAATRTASNCIGSPASLSVQFSGATGTSYSTWRGNTKMADTSLLDIQSLSLSDTASIRLLAVRNCNALEYSVRLNVNTQTIDLNNGLIRFWSMKASDNRRSMTNGISQYSFSLPEMGSGAIGRSSLDVNGAVNISSKDNQWINTDLGNEIQVNQPYTVSFWHSPLFTNQGSTEGHLISSTSTTAGAAVAFDLGNRVMVLNAAGTAIYSTPNAITHGTYTHITFTNDGFGNYKLYVNGRLMAAGSGASNIRPERIGNGRPGQTNRGARGSYDDLAIYNRVISDAEAFELYNLPQLNSTPSSVVACTGNQNRVGWSFAQSPSTRYTLLKNSQVFGVDSTDMTFTPTETDTTMGILISNTCASIQFQLYLNKAVTNLNDGLLRFWSLNARDREKSLTTDQNTVFRSEPTNMVYSTGRVGGTQTGVVFNTKTPHFNTGITGVTNTTISFWHRPNPIQSGEGVRALLGTTGSAVVNIELSGGQLNLRPLSPTGYLGPNYILAAGVWHHIVFVRNNSNYEIYVNDTLRMSGTGINTANIQFIGNTAGFTFGAPGGYDDLAIYNRALSKDEVNVLFNLPSIVSIPDTSVICAGASRNMSFTLSGGSTQAVYRLIKELTGAQYSQFVEINPNGTGGTTSFNLSTDRLRLTQRIGCTSMNYYFYPNVQGSSSAGPTLNYNPATRNISVNTGFNQVRLFRNGTLLTTNTQNGNLNYNSPFRCGSYFAEYITNGSSCPSISPTLNALPIDTFNRTASLCTGTTLAFGTLNITSPGTYVQTFNGVIGNCDSTVRLTVNSAQPTASTISRTGCGAVVIYGKTYTQSGQYIDTITNVAGCDSIVTINVTVTPGGPSVNNINATECYSYTLNGKTYTQSGIYRDTLVGASATGCDSILVLNLTLNVSRVTLPSQTACKQFVFNGRTITQGGTYSDTLTNAANCDSIVTILVSIANVNTFVTRTGNTLQAPTTGMLGYQWINCSNNQPISGATSSSFTPTVSGDYAVILTGSFPNLTCTDTSDCISVTVVPCLPMNITRTILNPELLQFCKDVNLTIQNAATPLQINVNWPSNPIGVNSTSSTLTPLIEGLCPATYRIKVTDNNGCVDSIVFTVIDVASCNLSVSRTILNPGNEPRCKSVQIDVQNGTYPGVLKLTSTSNPAGTIITMTSPTHTFNDLCPDTYKAVVFDDNGCGDSVTFIINEPTSILDVHPLSNVRVYPNPASGSVQIIGLPADAHIAIVDIHGRVVLQTISNADSSYSIEHIPTGVYMIQLTANDKVSTHKLVVSK